MLIKNIVINMNYHLCSSFASGIRGLIVNALAGRDERDSPVSLI